MARKVNTITMICKDCESMSDFNVYLDKKKMIKNGATLHYNYKYCRCPNCDSPFCTDEMIVYNKESLASI